MNYQAANSPMFKFIVYFHWPTIPELFSIQIFSLVRAIAPISLLMYLCLLGGGSYCHGFGEPDLLPKSLRYSSRLCQEITVVPLVERNFEQPCVVSIQAKRFTRTVLLSNKKAGNSCPYSNV